MAAAGKKKSKKKAVKRRGAVKPKRKYVRKVKVGLVGEPSVPTPEPGEPKLDEGTQYLQGPVPGI